MPRRRRTFRRIEHNAYVIDRTALDVRAALRGPRPFAKRIGRRSVTRSLFRLFR